jgi:choline dehydrogenase-like flavoprotein
MAGYDVLVVGGGTAGCTLAARLTEDPERRVCLLEAGPDYGSYASGSWPAEILDARQLVYTHDWGTGGEDERSLGARIIGGCSAHNACAVLQGTPADYDGWGPGWEYASFAPYLERAREMLYTGPANSATMAPFHEAFLAAAEAAGVQRLDDADDPSQPLGIAPFPANVVDGVRWNAAFAYLDAARGRPNLTIRDRTLVERVQLDGSRALGVTVADGEALEAPTVVLAAGAYFSPAVLLRSGVGPERELRALGIDVVAPLPVGERLLDHCGTGLGWELGERLQAETAAHEREIGGALFGGHLVVKAASSRCQADALDIHLLPWTNEVEGQPGRYEASCGAFAMNTLSQGRVRLRSTDPSALPHVERGFLQRAEDQHVIIEAIELARAIAACEPLRSVLAREVRPGHAKLDDYVRGSVRNYFHPAGTCAIGDVVDPLGRVLGLDGLIVCDASIMPALPRANTNLTVVAIAERLAETL